MFLDFSWRELQTVVERVFDMSFLKMEGTVSSRFWFCEL